MTEEMLISNLYNTTVSFDFANLLETNLIGKILK